VEHNGVIFGRSLEELCARIEWMREIVGLPDALLPDRSHIGSLDSASRVGTGRKAHSNVLDLSHVAKRQEVRDSAHINLLTSVLHCLERRNNLSIFGVTHVCFF
jgi:hypothetical protein